MRQEGQLLTTAPPSGQGNPIPYVQGNRNFSSTGFSQWLVLALKSAVSGWGWKITWREPNHRPGLYQPCPSTPTLTKAPFQQVCRTMALHLRPLLFDPTLPGFPWDKRGKMTVWWLHKSILSAGCCWGAGQRAELSAMLSLKNCAGMRLCHQS